MTKTNFLLAARNAAIALIGLSMMSAPRIIARPPPLPPDPGPPIVVTDEPTPTPTPAAVDPRPSATFTFSDATQIKTHGTRGRFRLVGLHLNEVVNIVVQFPTQWANTPLTLQALDGGNLSAQPANAVIAADGTVSFQFQAGNQPGLYRVAVIGAGGNSTLSFWAVDPATSQANPAVVNPSH
jgi:hypothetical protein